MTALAADRSRHPYDGPVQRITLPVNAGSVIYSGALVMMDATGYAVPAADTASCMFMGVANHAATGGTADGDVTVSVDFGHVERFACTGLVAAQQGMNAVISDDQTVTDRVAATNDIPIGKIMYLEGTSYAWLHVGVLSAVDTAAS